MRRQGKAVDWIVGLGSVGGGTTSALRTGAHIDDRHRPLADSGRRPISFVQPVVSPRNVIHERGELRGVERTVDRSLGAARASPHASNIGLLVQPTSGPRRVRYILLIGPAIDENERSARCEMLLREDRFGFAPPKPISEPAKPPTAPPVIAPVIAAASGPRGSSGADPWNCQQAQTGKRSADPRPQWP